MGLKRKASFDDYQSWSSPSPPTTDSVPSSASSTTTYPASSPIPRSLRDPWNVADAPYFNSRTRKRYRDGRPDEGTIHQNTLAKLFGAQRKTPRATGPSEFLDQERSSSPPVFAPDHPHYRLATTMEQVMGPNNLIEIPRERNQRSLDSFFGGGSFQQPLITSQVYQPPLPTSIHQPQEHVPHLIPPHPPTMPSILTCEDCSSPLLTKTSGEAVDAEMLDVDGPLVDLEVDEGWTCAECSKWVCDVCAVRGDYRVCLECAMPGGGKYKQDELREKRWVGGIGWV